MYLNMLDENNKVTQSVPLNAVAAGLLNIRLSSNQVITQAEVPVNHVYDDESKTFAAVRNPWITKLAFDNRFTIAEAVKLKAMQVFPQRNENEIDADYIARTQVPAQLQVLASRLNMASYIDLSRPDTIQSVNSLEALGLLDAGRAAEILSTEIGSHEYHPSA